MSKHINIQLWNVDEKRNKKSNKYTFLGIMM